MKLLECLAERRVEGIDGTVTLRGHLEITVTIPQRDGCLTRRGGSGSIVTETTMIPLQFKERSVQTQFLAD